MNERARAGEPTLADVQAEFPDWRPSRGPSGMYYAGRPDTAQVMGEDPLDLRDQILGWIGRHEGYLGIAGIEDPRPAGSHREA